MSSEDADVKETSSKDLKLEQRFLQEIQSFDLFKAIFENENDVNETKEEEEEDESGEVVI